MGSAKCKVQSSKFKEGSGKWKVEVEVEVEVRSRSSSTNLPLFFQSSKHQQHSQRLDQFYHPLWYLYPLS